MNQPVEHKGLRRYLLGGENPVAEIRYHGIVLLKPALLLLLATLLVLWIDLSVSDAAVPALKWVWLVWLGVLGWAAWQWIEWRHTRVVATDRRIVLFEGWINHKVSMMPLKKVTDMGYERSLLGRLLGYGTFVLESAGQDQALSKISYVPAPDENYRAICAVVFGVSDEPEEDVDRDDEDPAWETSEDDAARLGGVEGVHVGLDQRPRGDSIYRSADRNRGREGDTGELPPYDPFSY
ncbi:PH domain-containing protein [Janibacter corallicola]|uniref:PH domain-containing protein n=1 Tax=Janibacter corallicola TaxID=415212 RepID=UPI000835D39D|nr:PH domain-containing protein [Janibacter corallicola]